MDKSTNRHIMAENVCPMNPDAIVKTFQSGTIEEGITFLGSVIKQCCDEKEAAVNAKDTEIALLQKEITLVRSNFETTADERRDAIQEKEEAMEQVNALRGRIRTLEGQLRQSQQQLRASITLEAAVGALQDGLLATVQRPRVLPAGFGEGASTSRDEPVRTIQMTAEASYQDPEEMRSAFENMSTNVSLREFLQNFNFDTTDRSGGQINDERLRARLNASFAQKNAQTNEERAKVLLDMIQEHNQVELNEVFIPDLTSFIAAILANNGYAQKVTHSKYEQLVTRMGELRTDDPVRYRQVLAKYGVPYTSDVKQAATKILSRQ